MNCFEHKVKCALLKYAIMKSLYKTYKINPCKFWLNTQNDYVEILTYLPVDYQWRKLHTFWIELSNGTNQSITPKWRHMVTYTKFINSSDKGFFPDDTNWILDKKCLQDDLIKWKYFSRYWPFVQIIHRSPVNSPRKGQRRGALMLSLICA